MSRVFSRTLRVLVVDDDPDVLRALRRALREFHVVTASNAEEALARAEVSGPQVVVTDLHMPGMSGQDLIVSLNKRFGAHAPMAIVLTSDTAATVPEAKRLLHKPADIDKLAELIREVAGVSAPPTPAASVS